MATPVGTILCLGMLGLGSVILVVTAIASAFIVVPVEEGPSASPAGHAAGTLRTRERQYTTAV